LTQSIGLRRDKSDQVSFWSVLKMESFFKKIGLGRKSRRMEENFRAVENTPNAESETQDSH
jgi:hypothetical protein